MEKNTILIKRAHILSPVEGLDMVGDILIRDGMIVSVEKEISSAEEKDMEIIDAEGAYAAPGFVDVHTHFRDPGQTEKEDIHTGAMAAAAGGYTTVICMANTLPPVDSPGMLEMIGKKADEELIHIRQCAALTKGRQGQILNDLAELKRAGAAGFTDDGSPVMDGDLVKRAMMEAAELGMVLSFHEEDPEYIGVAGINEGAVSREMGLMGAKREAEISMVERDLEYALETGCRIDIQHVSAKETVELIRKAKMRDERGIIHAEATPNHFSLTEEAVRKHGSLAKINPPLRTEEDRQGIIEGLKDGTIDIIATDHAPHTRSDKGKEFQYCMSGIIGLETALSLGLKYLVEPGHIGINDLIRLMSVNPAALYGLKAGHLLNDAPGDIVLFSDSENTKYDSFKSRSDNSPFRGSVLPGRILCTIAGGRKAY